MKSEINIRLAGEAGQGVETLGLILCRALKKSGLNFFAAQDYMSRIRGGNNFLQYRVASQPVASFRDRTDLLVALDQPSVGLHAAAVSKNGLIVREGKPEEADERDRRLWNVPLKEIAQGKGGAPLFANTVALGVIAGLLGLPFENLDAVLRLAFSGKGGEMVNKNIAAADGGFQYALKNKPRDFAYLSNGKMARQFFINGNEAIALGALAAGVQFYSAYPMTPSTSIMNTLVGYARRFKLIVEQAEDEIAAVNMAIGASFAGARAMTGTSGGGFALMTEGLSLAGMTETPLVVAVAQRPGPATGLPTRTEQGDLNFVLHAGHGEFARAVFSPGTAAEAYAVTVRAFDLAARFQIPVIILTDQYLADSLVNTPVFKTGPVVPAEDIIPRGQGKGSADYKRYAITAGGVSPRAVPGWIDGVIYADSDEHSEEGHITESAAMRRKMVEKRFLQKMKRLESKALPPVYHGEKKAKTFFIGFGSTAPVLKEAREMLGDPSVGVVHLPQVWPLPKKKLMELLRTARAVHTVENNAGAQLAGLLRRELGTIVKDSILKYDGRPFSLDEMLKAMKGRV
jgi:2-oxoglutarate ferredoxin oxidoreductase subunit alpha